MKFKLCTRVVVVVSVANVSQDSGCGRWAPIANRRRDCTHTHTHTCFGTSFHSIIGFTCRWPLPICVHQFTTQSTINQASGERCNWGGVSTPLAGKEDENKVWHLVFLFYPSSSSLLLFIHLSALSGFVSLHIMRFPLNRFRIWATLTPSTPSQCKKKMLRNSTDTHAQHSMCCQHTRALGLLSSF